MDEAAPDLGDVLRGMAAEAPSGGKLLAGVHAAAARAAVRRRLVAASVVVLALVGVMGAVSATGAGAPGGTELVLGDPDETPAPGTTLDPSPSNTPAPGPSGSAALQEPTVASGGYAGRAVDRDGRPIPGLYVYAIPVGAGWGAATLAGSTGADGSFDIPCSTSLVVLNAFRIGVAQDGSTANWRTTFVGGGHLLDQAGPVRCAGERESTTVPRGLMFYGSVGDIDGCADLSRWRIAVELLELRSTQSTDDGRGDVAFGQSWLSTGITLSTSYPSYGRFQIAGLATDGTYAVRLLRDDGYEWHEPYDDNKEDHWDIDADGGQRAQLTWNLRDGDCSASASPTPLGEPTPSGEPQPTSTSPEPEPESTPTPDPEAT